jgi:hypothetical protein
MVYFKPYRFRVCESSKKGGGLGTLVQDMRRGWIIFWLDKAPDRWKEGAFHAIFENSGTKLSFFDSLKTGIGWLRALAVVARLAAICRQGVISVFNLIPKDLGQ